MQESENKRSPEEAGAQDADAKHLAARRKFLRIGLLTGPVVLTLASRPVFATPAGPSVGMSGNVSQFGVGVWQRLQGLTPGFWKQPQHKCYWAPDPLKPNQYKYGDAQTVIKGKKTETVYVNGTKFKSVFSASPLDANLTLLDALNLGGGGANALARIGTAALLNANHPQIFYRFHAESVIGMVNAAFTSGNTEELKNFLDAENNREGVGFGRCP